MANLRTWANEYDRRTPPTNNTCPLSILPDRMLGVVLQLPGALSHVSSPMSAATTGGIVADRLLPGLGPRAGDVEGREESCEGTREGGDELHRDEAGLYQSGQVHNGVHRGRTQGGHEVRKRTTSRETEGAAGRIEGG